MSADLLICLKKQIGLREITVEISRSDFPFPKRCACLVSRFEDIDQSARFALRFAYQRGLALHRVQPLE